ncbi:Immunity protein 21 [Micromonospora citrea]|uniref:Immunity protein 21 n=1 Tax=Micromonospora citrea TaxID=47855 RepID=A0A1C6TTU8_9ACTN|nr:Imm21 family immunity protein [Micromonospora citrea]SCL45099.1 Immunity protein 21 [Micromonospora citrea]
MSDLPEDLAPTRRPAGGRRWIDSSGGPLVVVPATALPAWRGVPDDFDPDDLDTWGDYGRACAVEGNAGVLRAGDAEALVLADEPAATTYLPERRLFVRRIRAERGAAGQRADADADADADSEAEVVRLVPEAVERADWEDAGSWTTDGPAELFDAALGGDEAAPTGRLRVEVEPGTYRLRTACVEIGGTTALGLVHLAG